MAYETLEPILESTWTGEPIPQGRYQVQWCEGGQWNFDSGWHQIHDAIRQAMHLSGGQPRVVDSELDQMIWLDGIPLQPRAALLPAELRRARS